MINHLISLMVALPFAGAILQALLPGSGSSEVGGETSLSRPIALATSLLSALCGFVLVISLQTQIADLQMTESLPWVGSYAISYDMGVDGLNALMILLVSILFPILIASEWNQKIGGRGMHSLFLILQSAFLGAICAQNLFLQLFFWAFTALPFYFLIGVWGGENRETAAFRGIVAASIGNALLFAALLLIYYSVDPHSFSIRDLAGGKLAGKSFLFLGKELPVSVAAFLLISFGLALRAPIWPFHGWFTQVAQEAPLSVVVAMSGVTVPVATYVFIRLSYSLFPEVLTNYAHIIVAVGTVNLLVGGICAVAQTGLRLLLAYTCLSQVGMMLLGIGSLSSAGLVGAIYQQLALGLGLAGFGLFSNLVNERAGHSQFIREDGKRAFGGIAIQAPAVAVVAGVVMASLLGFPGFSGFVGYSLVIIGSYAVHPLAVVLAGVAVLLAVYYLFTMYRYVFLGNASGPTAFADLTFRERMYLLPLVACLLFLGLYPKPLVELVRPTVSALLTTINRGSS